MSTPTDTQRMEKIVSLCKRRGFIFQSSEIYGGLNGAWDYGPLGVELKRNLKNYWWRVMVHERDDVVGMDGAIFMNRAVWKASGHEDTFSDPMVDCLLTKKRFRADQIEPQSGTVFYFAGAIDEQLMRETFDYSLGDIDEPKRRRIRRNIIDQCKNLDELTNHPDADVREFAKKSIRGKRGDQFDVDEPFSVFLPKGKPPESAHKIAIQYYQQRGLANPTLSW